jgi:hypothetical protein
MPVVAYEYTSTYDRPVRLHIASLNAPESNPSAGYSTVLTNWECCGSNWFRESDGPELVV